MKAFLIFLWDCNWVPNTNSFNMKKIIQLTFTILISYPSAYSQFFVGAKGSYDQYFDSQMHGFSLGIFTEIPTGEYLNNSCRISFFYGLPMKNIDPRGGSIYSKNSTSSLSDYLPLSVTSTIKNIGLSFEDLYYFDNDAFSSSFYTIIKAGISSSSITRKAEYFDPTSYALNEPIGNNKQTSLYLGIGCGYQYALGRNSLLFAEINFGLPFIGLKSVDGGNGYPGGNLDYPLLILSGSIGFKQSVFN